MTDDEWLTEQQRLHNQRTFAYELPPIRPIPRRRQPFTLEQLEIAERWAEQQAQKASSNG